MSPIVAQPSRLRVVLDFEALSGHMFVPRRWACADEVCSAGLNQGAWNGLWALLECVKCIDFESAEASVMSRKCTLSGKKRLVGYQISHAHNKTKKVQQPNVQWKRIYVPEQNRFVRIKVSTRMLRTITRKGLMGYLRDNNMTLKDVT